MQDFSLYASDGGTNLFPNTAQNPAFDFTKGGGGSSGTSGGSGGAASGGLIGAASAFKDTTAGKVAIEFAKAIGTSLSVSKASESDKGPPKGDTPQGSSTSSGSGAANPAEQSAKEQEDKAKKEQQEQEKQEKEKQEKLAKEAADGKEKEEEEKKDKDGNQYVDPDQQVYSGTAFAASPEQIEMRLNGRKRPVNPNTDGATSQVDTSSPPPRHGGIDPTLARFDGEVYGSASFAQGEMKASIAPIDHHRDHEPPTPTGSPTGTGGGDTDPGRGYP